MKGEELKFMREYKKLQTEIEDTIMTEVNDKVSELLDKRCTEKYDLAQRITKEALESMNTMKIVVNGINYNNYIKALDNFHDQADPIFKYFNESNDLSNEVMSIVNPLIQPKASEIHELIIVAKYTNLQQVSRNMKLQMKKLDTNILYLLNQIISQTINTYKKLIHDEFKRVLEMSSKNEEIFNNAINEAKSRHKQVETKAKQKFQSQKIFDYKKLDVLIKSAGYEAIRQTGSHKIYSDGVKTIPIPQHSYDLGIGLSCRIQKQIQIQ